VVDAGAKGLVLLLDAFHVALTGEPPSEPVGPAGPVGPHAEVESAPAAVELAFEVQYLLEAEDDRVPVLRHRLGEIGDSLVVVGGGGLYHVHVHTNVPGAAVEEALDAGRPREVSIVRLEGRPVDCMGGQARAVRVAEQTCALVAVAEGEGLSRTFRSLGGLVVPGGPGANPSVEDLLHAIEAAPAEEVIVLPNHPNIRPAAEQAARASVKHAWVVATESIPAGIAAATAFNPMTALDGNADDMAQAAGACRAGELARAERDADTEAGQVRTGDWLALAGDRVVAVGHDPGIVASGLVRSLADGDAELLTLVTGSEAPAEEVDRVVAAVRRSLPGLDVEVIDGGQSRYPYLMGIE
jgi:dihydroxyacetone kinase-like predicted kinase